MHSTGFNCALVITDRPSQTTAEDVLSHVVPVNAASRRRDLVLLVSRGFAPRLSDGGDFHSDLINRVYPATPAHGFQRVQEVNVLTAVVDRLPTGRAPGGSSQGFTGLAPKLGGGVGSEGVAYFEAQAGLALALDDPSHTPPDAAVATRQRDLVRDESASVLFRLAGGDAEHSSVPAAVELALANTTFSNGRPYVLDGTVWVRQPEEADGRLQRQEDRFKEFKNISVTLPLGALGGPAPPERDSKAVSDGCQVDMEIPLTPLTPRRTVSASMGNVVRGLGGAQSGASTELEEAVTQYFADRDMLPRAAAVWAFVVPKELLDDDVGVEEMPTHRNALGGSNQPTTATDLEGVGPPYRTLQLLWRGARLHKVLSGGGGWGSKAGLLSIDSYSGFGAESAEEQARKRGILSDDADEEDFGPPMPMSLVRDVVRPGDTIQFFIAPEPAPPVTTVETNGVTRTTDGKGPTSPTSWITFGTAANSTDEVSPRTTTHGNPSHPSASGTAKEVRVLNGCFGALSESGISLVRDQTSPPTLTRTKIDVPFSHLSVRRLT